MNSINFIKFLFLSLMTICLQAELIDDLVEIVLHNARGKELLKRALERDVNTRRGANEAATLGDKLASTVPRSSSNQPTSINLNYGHTGWRGGKKEDLESLIRTSLEKKTSSSANLDAVNPPSLPWKDASSTDKKNPPSIPWARDADTSKPPSIPWKKRTAGKNSDGNPPPNLPWKRSYENAPPSLPWAARDEHIDEIEKKKRLYKRLMEDINEYVLLKNKLNEKRKTTEDISSDLLSKLNA